MYEPLKGFENDYEICNEYPYEIRRIKNGFVPKIHLTSDGYQRININGRCQLVHRLIAIQFIPNPNELPEIDHINGIRTDNHIENLRWSNRSNNMRNLHQQCHIDYEFVDELEANSFEVEFASKWEFKNYFVCGDNVLYFDGDRYRVLVKHPNGKQWHVYMNDIDKIKHTITRNKLREALRDLYDMEFFTD